MAKAEVLAEMAEEVRHDTLRILANTDPSWLKWSPPGTSNHILWHAGHALWLLDRLGVALLCGRSELPDGWDDMFGAESKPGNNGVAWPDREKIEQLLKKQLQRVVELLKESRAETLAQVVGKSTHERTLGGWILHAIHDEAKHSGEMYLLFKMSRWAPG